MAGGYRLHRGLLWRAASGGGLRRAAAGCLGRRAARSGGLRRAASGGGLWRAAWRVCIHAQPGTLGRSRTSKITQGAAAKEGGCSGGLFMLASAREPEGSPVARGEIAGRSRGDRGEIAGRSRGVCDGRSRREIAGDCGRRLLRHSQEKMITHGRSRVICPYLRTPWSRHGKRRQSHATSRTRRGRSCACVRCGVRACGVGGCGAGAGVGRRVWGGGRCG